MNFIFNLVLQQMLVEMIVEKYKYFFQIPLL